MLSLDSSALIAMITGEPEAARFKEAILTAKGGIMSAVNHLECRMVLGSRFGSDSIIAYEALLTALKIDIEPLSRAQSDLALDAFQRFGKGQGHPAQLNLADCCAYALAKSRDLPLLFKGNDFSRTDTVAASY